MNDITFLEHYRFDLIYFLSLKLPSWEIIGSVVLGKPVTEEELNFVISKTRNGGLKNGF